jgi:hypothetical protein
MRSETALFGLRPFLPATLKSHRPQERDPRYFARAFGNGMLFRSTQRRILLDVGALPEVFDDHDAGANMLRLAVQNRLPIWGHGEGWITDV